MLRETETVTLRKIGKYRPISMPLMISYDFAMGNTPDLVLPWPEKHSVLGRGSTRAHSQLPARERHRPHKAARGAVQIATGRLIAIISASFGALASSVSGPKGADVIEQD
jgi:hypothetical protein